MLDMFEKNKHLLTERGRNKLRKRLEQLVGDKRTEEGFVSICESYLASKNTVDEYTGFKAFDLEKVKNVILYITEQSKSILKTKINKLLFYVDFLYFKIHSVSMTGNQYVHLQYGPIPNDYDWILSLMTSEDLLEKNEVMFSSKVVGEELTAKESVDKELFTNDELHVIDYCIKTFENYNCVQISEYSHNEVPYKETEEKKNISYKLAKDLSLNID